MSKISDMTRESWIMSTFPEWGTWLNEDIEREEVKPGTVAMWWLGCTGIWMKTPGGANISIDLWCGNGKRTHGDDKMKVGHQMANMCGARRMQPNLRAIPFVFDPFGFKQVDAVLATHYHQDHMSAEWAAHVINSGMTTVDENGQGDPRPLHRAQEVRGDLDKVGRPRRALHHRKARRRAPRQGHRDSLPRLL